MLRRTQSKISSLFIGKRDPPTDKKRERMFGRQIQSFSRDHSGATAIEYGLIAALVSVIAISSLSAIGGNVNQTFSTLVKSMDDAPPPPAAGAPR